MRICVRVSFALINIQVCCAVQNDALKLQHAEVEDENIVLRKKLERAVDENLCIPRLEEKMHRETREKIREKDLLMRQKEMHWNQ